MQSYRWLFYAVNGLGLGHLTRTLALARQLRSRFPNSQFLFLTTSEASELFWQEGFASVKLPSRMVSKRSGIRYGSYNQLLHTLVVNTISAYHPHVLVVDTFPAGSAKELLPVLRWSGKRVFLYREQKPVVCNDPGFQQFLQLYDRILIPHHPKEVQMPVPEQVPMKWTGPMLIRDRQDALSRAEARERLGLPRNRCLLYVGFGGGGDLAYAKLLNWVLEQQAHIPDWVFVVAIPPLSQTSSVPNHPKIQTVRYYPMAECWRAFDGAISAAGYNSVSELLHHGVPTIWVPLNRQVDQQHIRVDRIVAQGMGWCANPFDTDALQKGLTQLSDRDLRQKVARATQIHGSRNGAVVAAEYLQKWILS